MNILRGNIPILVLLAAFIIAGAYARYLKAQLNTERSEKVEAKQLLAATQDSLRVVKETKDSLTVALAARPGPQDEATVTVDPDSAEFEGESTVPTEEVSLDSLAAEPNEPVRHQITQMSDRYRLEGWIDVYSRYRVQYKLTADMRPFSLRVWQQENRDGIIETRVRAPRGVPVTNLRSTTKVEPQQQGPIGVELAATWTPDLQAITVGYRRSFSLPFVPVHAFGAASMDIGVTEPAQRPRLSVGIRF